MRYQGSDVLYGFCREMIILHITILGHQGIPRHYSDMGGVFASLLHDRGPLHVIDLLVPPINREAIIESIRKFSEGLGEFLHMISLSY